MAEYSGFIRPLLSQENMLYSMNLNGQLYISYVLRISSTRKITEEDSRKVFTILYRKTPTLRLCVQEKEGHPWYKQMNEEKIDLEVIENADIYKTYHEVTDNPVLNFSKGPLWSVKLLPYCPAQDSYIKMTSSTTCKPAKHENIQHIVILYSHAVTDGYSCLRITRTILDLFNAVLAGEEINESEQICTLIDAKHEKEKCDQIEKKFIDDPKYLEERKNSYASFALETLFEKAYPVDPFIKPKTMCLVHVVDRETTAKFISRCKKEGVTIHTGFCSVAEATLIKMLLNKGFDQETYKISSLQAADSRVYYKSKDEFGVGMGIMDFTHIVSKEDALHNFWAFAKTYHSGFKKQHSFMPALEHSVIGKLTGFNPIVVTPKEGLAAPHSQMSYYTTTNMRDVTAFLDERGNNVQLEYLDRLSTIATIPALYMNTFNTFRGEFLHSLQYNTNFVDSKTAQTISDILFETFSQVCDL